MHFEPKAASKVTYFEVSLLNLKTCFVTNKKLCPYEYNPNHTCHDVIVLTKLTWYVVGLSGIDHILFHKTVGKYANTDRWNDLFTNQTDPIVEFNSLTEQLSSSV